MSISDCIEMLENMKQTQAAEPSSSTKKKQLALMFSLEGGEVTSKIQVNHSSEDLTELLNALKDGNNGYLPQKFMDKYEGCLQMHKETIENYAERIKYLVESKFSFLPEETREDMMRDLLLYGMLSTDGKNKIIARNAGWEEAKEIAQEDEDEIISTMYAKEIYQYTLEKEKEEKEKKEKREKEEKDKNEREKNVAQKSKEKIAKAPDLEQEKEKFRFSSLDLLSLFVTMTLKRIVNNEMKPKEHFDFLLKIIEDNLKRMKIVDRECLFDTLRDHTRMYRREWSRYHAEIPRPSIKVSAKERLNRAKKGTEECKDESRILYNTYLMVLSLKLGLKKPWVPEGFTGFNLKVLKRELADLYGKDPPELALRQLSQNYPCFDFLFPLCRDLEQVFLHRCDGETLITCFTLHNLRILEFHGLVAEKFLCVGLWGVNKSSKKVLEMALTDPSEFTLSLPHLEVIRINVLEGYCTYFRKVVTASAARNYLFSVPDFMLQLNTLPVTFGAAALAIQPTLNVVENLGTWETTDAILYLLDKEAQLKKNQVQLGLRKIMVDCQSKLDFAKLKKVTQLCPKLNSAAVRHYQPFPTQPLCILKALPMKNILELNLNVVHMPARDLVRILDAAPVLEVMTLVFDPRCPIISDIANGFLQFKMQSDQRLVASHLKTLTLEFTKDDMYDGLGVDSVAWNSEDMMAFLQLFPSITTLHLDQTMGLPPALLVYGCMGGALACLTHLRHLSLMLCHRDLPHEIFMMSDSKGPVDLHCKLVSSLIPDLQAKATFPHLAALKTLEIDELYLLPCVDRLLEALRMEGVNVSTLYRSSIRSLYGRHDATLVDFPLPS